MSKRSYIMTIGGAIAVLIVAAGIWYFTSDLYKAKQFAAYVATLTQEQQKLVDEMSRKATSLEPEMENATSPEPFVRAALEWKSIGEAIVAQDPASKKYALKKSIGYYEAAILQLGETNALLFSSAGDVYKSLGEYETAQEYYQQAIDLEPGNPMHFLKLADFYRYRLNKPPEEVLAVYARALERLIYNTEVIFKARAVYYEEIGKLREAALDWQKVISLEPNNTAVKAEFNRLVRELEARGETLEVTTTTPSAAK